MSITEILLYITIIVLFVVLLYLVYNRKQFAEGFADNPTSLSLYTANKSDKFDKQMELYKDTLGDINDFLLVYGCGINLGMAPDALRSLVKVAANGLYMVPFSVLSSNYQDVNSKVHKIIEDFYEKNNRTTIQGQVYVVVSQSPFYRDVNNNPISIQYNANSYLAKSSYLMDNKDALEESIIQFSGYVIFNAYYNSGRLIGDTNTRKEAVLKIKRYFRQKESLCFVKCPNHNNLPCGCASRNKPYVSNCLETDRSGKMTPGHKYTYAILYRVNPRFGDLISKKILTLNYSDYQWSPSSIVPIPKINGIRIIEAKAQPPKKHFIKKVHIDTSRTPTHHRHKRHAQPQNRLGKFLGKIIGKLRIKKHHRHS